jgi:hypothetical protein
MKLTLAVLLILLVFPVLSQAQNQTQVQGQENDLRTLLQDASYVFNRFDEEATGLQVAIDRWNLDASSKVTFKKEVSAVLQNVNSLKPTLNQLLSKNQVSSTDLFDIYSQVAEVGAESFGQASNVSNWGEAAKAIELANLGSKATVLSANIGAVLRHQIVVQERQLEACSRQPVPPSPAAKHQ